MSVADHPSAQDDDRKKKKLGVVLLSLLLIVALGVGGFLYYDKNKKTTDDAGQGEVFLAAASEPASTPDPFGTTSAAFAPDTTIALPATDPAPINQPAATSTVATSGGTPGLYGAQKNKTACDVDGLVKRLSANASNAAKWSAALNADTTLRWNGPTLDEKTVGVYLRNLTPTLLVSDTRLTANGVKTARQVVMQKGTAVLVDKYGVPRVRCSDYNPLTAPVPTKTKPKYKAKAWKDLDLKKVAVVQGNATPLAKLVVRTPATPQGKLATLPVGPYSCVTTNAVCSTPSGATKPSPNSPPTASPSPTASASPTVSTPAPAPTSPTSPQTSPAAVALSTKAGSIDVSNQETVTINGQQGIKVYPKFLGYSPNSKVNFTCSDSTGTIFSGFAIVDANGDNNDNDRAGFCQSTRPGFKYTDHLNTSVSVN